LPVVLAVEETLLVLSQLSGVKQLMARFIYGSGLRLMECHRLREAFAMSIELVCFWLFSPVYYPYNREEVFSN